jgi:hypothetical protein
MPRPPGVTIILVLPSYANACRLHFCHYREQWHAHLPSVYARPSFDQPSGGSERRGFRDCDDLLVLELKVPRTDADLPHALAERGAAIGAYGVQLCRDLQLLAPAPPPVPHAVPLRRECGPLRDRSSGIDEQPVVRNPVLGQDPHRSGIATGWSCAPASGNDTTTSLTAMISPSL